MIFLAIMSSLAVLLLWDISLKLADIRRALHTPEKIKALTAQLKESTDSLEQSVNQNKPKE